MPITGDKPEIMEKDLFKNLDVVLERLASNKAAKKCVFFKDVCKSAAHIEDVYKIKELRQRLIIDGYIKTGGFGDGDPPDVTVKGIAFLSKGGYAIEEKEKNWRKLKRVIVVVGVLLTAVSAAWTIFR